jgi:hypothetical protein
MTTETFVYGSDGIPKITKVPLAVLDYLMNWQPYLSPINDTILSKTVTCDDNTLTIVSSEIVNGNNVLIWISGGTIGVTYTITCQITTSFGRTDARVFKIECVVVK